MKANKFLLFLLGLQFSLFAQVEITESKTRNLCMTLVGDLFHTGHGNFLKNSKN